jgi:predicted Holliday junction resolvase-like endonuclease
MTNALIILIVALAFLLIGFLWGKGKQREESFKETKRAIEGQRATIKGKVAENVTPLLPDFEKQFPNLNIADARFIGEPIDYLFFEGMSEGKINKVLFLEVKSGKRPRLNDHENSLKEVIDDAEKKGANVGWREYNVPQ